MHRHHGQTMKVVNNGKMPNKPIKQDKKQLAFAPSSLILANHYLACYLGVGIYIEVYLSD